MAWTIGEDWKGRVRNNADMRREYILVWDGTGDSDDTSAATALFNYLADPANIPGIPLATFPQNDIGVTEISGEGTISFRGFGTWATYRNIAGGYVYSPIPIAPDEITFTFNAEAAGGNIQSSLNTVYAILLSQGIEFPDIPIPFGNTADFNGLINVEGTGKDLKIKGLDLAPPPTSFDINLVLKNSELTGAVIRDFMKWVGTTNQADFILFGQTYAKQELFYNSVQGTRRTNEDWEVSFTFSYSRDRGGIEFEDNPDGPYDQTDWVKVMAGKFKVPMHGFDYVWIYNLPAWDDVEKDFRKPGKKATAFVEKVWEDHNWSTTALDALQTLTIVDQPPDP